jgi:diguanylate cyclase (GGDEF)-like protein
VHAAERLRSAVEKHRLVFEGARIPIAASFGVAVWPGDGREPDDLLASADRALYAAKQAGRNCVKAASEVPTGPIETP